MNRFFYAIFIGDPFLQRSLDVLRLLANPDEKWPAHITVRGPYSEELEIDPKILAVEGKTVRITGVGDFFDSSQNTVYLKCQSRVLRQVWDKPHFGYCPHITLYDGSSRPFARHLKDVLSGCPLQISFPATGLTRLVSRKGERKNLLLDGVESMGVSWLLHEHYTTEDLPTLDGKTRLLLISKIWSRIAEHYGFVRSREGELPFPIEKSKPAVAPSRLALRSLLDVASQAYLRVHDGYSIDRVLADPHKNREFIHECWRLGADATEFDLNRALLRVRKSAQMGPITTVQRHVVPAQRLDEYIWGVEIALRLLQNEEERERQLWVSVDRILCDPSLSYRFDNLARSIVPGFKAGEYRWAALVLRKNSSRSMPGFFAPFRFQDVGSLSQVYDECLYDGPGLYWIHSNRKDIFIGQAACIRQQLQRMSQLKVQEIPHLHRPLSHELNDARVAVAKCPSLSATDRQALRASLVCSRSPLLNVRLGRFLAA
jgi:hypothetical protein